MRFTIFFTVLLVYSWSMISAQVGFINRNDLLAEKDLHSGVPVAIADMNGDGLDDIVALDGAMELYIQYQTPDPSRPFVRYKAPVFIDNNEQNDICIADFNNDGANDILMVGSYDRVKVFYSVPKTYDFNLTYIVVTPFFSQGASTGDFNQDGWVDVVMLNDNGLNYTLLNDGAGNLVEQDLFNFVTVPASDNSGNYGSVYSDFDMDGDLDFYIAKCRQGVNNPNDPRRINVLFVNDGNGNYTENAARYGLASGRQTWTADFGDMDNDGDMDCFMTQHDVISELYENINNDTFINITTQSGLNIPGIALQGMFRDFDNDGFQDILVSGDRLDFYRNNGDKTFTKQTPFGNIVFGTFSFGDLNNDGFTDVYASRVIPFNNPDELREDILFIGEKNENHFLSLSLTDTAGNPSAIGAMAMLYGSWGVQVREVRGGEQYGVSNGHSIIFGLGQNTTYDSLIIRWPDGTREEYNDLVPDQSWWLRRGGCRKQTLDVLPQLEVLCNDDSVILKVDVPLALTEWSNGAVSDSIIVQETGIYYATLLDDDGCPVRTSPIEITIDPDTIKPTITYVDKTLLCDGEIAVLSLPAGLSYLWSSGETTQTIEATTTGDFFADVEGYCQFQTSDTVHLEFIIPDLPATTGDTFLTGESALLFAVGDSVQWFSDEQGINQIGTGEVLVLDNLTDTTVVYAQNLVAIGGQDYQVGPFGHSGATKYNANFVNGGLLFEVHEPLIIEQITVQTDSAGIRAIEISDASGVIFEKEVDIPAGTTIVDLNAELPIGSFTISTNVAVNNQTFGTTSPFLWRTFQTVLYPYEVSGVISITNSTFDMDYYYYFYNWKVSSLDRYCYSELVPVTAMLDLGVATEDPTLDGAGFIITPNPTDGLSSYAVKTSGLLGVEIYAMDGTIFYREEKKVLEGDTGIIDLSSYPSGIYMIRFVRDGKSHCAKLIKL